MKRTRSFGVWTRTDYRPAARWRRPGRAVLVFCGTALILVAIVSVLVDARVVGSASDAQVAAPRNDTLRLTVPRMKRVNNTPVYSAAATDTKKLDASAIRIQNTGLPWQEEANVYIAGHRLGYPRTGSFLLFYDLNKLVRGDKVVLEDAKNRRYVYRVYEKLIVDPDQTSVMKPIEGKSTVSLQACTLPDYSRRLIVRAELVEEGEAER